MLAAFNFVVVDAGELPGRSMKECMVGGATEGFRCCSAGLSEPKMLSPPGEKTEPEEGKRTAALLFEVDIHMELVDCAGEHRICTGNDGHAYVFPGGCCIEKDIP